MSGETLTRTKIIDMFDNDTYINPFEISGGGYIQADGPAPANNPENGLVFDILPPSATETANAENVIVWELGYLAPYQSGTVEYKLMVKNITVPDTSTGYAYIESDQTEPSLTATQEEIDVPQILIANAGGVYNAYEGVPFNLNAGASIATNTTITSYQWDIDNDGGYDTTGIAPEVIWNDNTQTIVRLRITDEKGNFSEDYAMINVHNVAPEIDFIQDFTIIEGESVVLMQATYVDPGTLDTHTARIDWKDGTDDQFTVTNGLINTEHIFNFNGIYTPEITITDDDGGENSVSFTVNVMRNPLNMTIELENDSAVKISFNTTTGKQYEIWYLDDEIDHFSFGPDWKFAGNAVNGIFEDMGGPGIDGITGTDDDRIHPKDVSVRYYRIIEAGSINSGDSWGSKDIGFIKNIHLYQGRNFIAKVGSAETLNEVLDCRFLPANAIPSLSASITYWNAGLSVDAYVAEYADNKLWFSIDGSKEVGNDIIYNGAGLLLTIPQGYTSLKIPMVGKVQMEDIISIPIKTNDYTMAGWPYSTEVSLENSKLIENGFAGGTTSRVSDKIYFWNPQTQRYDLAVYYYTGELTPEKPYRWRYMDNSQCTRTIKPGESILIRTISNSPFTTWQTVRPYPRTNNDLNP